MKSKLESDSMLTEFFVSLSKNMFNHQIDSRLWRCDFPVVLMERFSIIIDNEISSCFGIGDCSNSIKTAHHCEWLTVLRFMYTTRLIASLKKRANCVAFFCAQPPFRVREHILIDTTNFFPWTYGMLRSRRRLNAATTAKSWRNNQTFLHASDSKRALFEMSLKSTFKDHQREWVCLSDIADGLEWMFFHSSGTATIRRWMQSIHDCLIWCKFGLVHVTLCFLLPFAFCCAAYVPYCAHTNTPYFISIDPHHISSVWLSQISDFSCHVVHV